jgi:glycosyltransferase involved in cell wall biosynthesis
VIAENPALAPLIRVSGYPIDWRLINQETDSFPPGFPRIVAEEVTLGFVGRIHEEKGLLLLAAALKIVQQTPDLPPWRLLLCGPSNVEQGGSGATFRTNLQLALAQGMPSDRFTLLDPQFNPPLLASIYRRLAIFCFPSLAEKGETFGVAVAEAMAAGAVPVVSRLACFTDLVRDGQNGVVFDHTATDAAAQLANALVQLLREPTRRIRLSAAARQDARIYDYNAYAETLLADFAQLTAPANPTSSAT